MTKTPHSRVAFAHDAFFKMAMTNKRVAREFFTAHLPIDLLEKIDLNNLEVQSGSYIDDYRQEAVADMLFKMRMNGHDGYLYLVVDHQSKPDELMPFRMLKYICNIIDQSLKSTKTKRIPLVIPMVVYHGKAPWRYSVNIVDLIDAPRELAEHYFLKPFRLIDLTNIEDEVLKQYIWSGVMELTLKHIYARDMMPFIKEMLPLLKKLHENEGKNFLETVLVYMLDRGQLSNKEVFFDLVKTQLSEELGENIMSITDQAWEEGMQQGMQQGAQQIALRMLSKGIAEASIAEMTGLSMADIKSLRKQSNH
jgi:predicted transposase/invertase (TIGR01784 family)